MCAPKYENLICTEPYGRLESSDSRYDYKFSEPCNRGTMQNWFRKGSEVYLNLQ